MPFPAFLISELPLYIATDPRTLSYMANYTALRLASENSSASFWSPGKCLRVIWISHLFPSDMWGNEKNSSPSLWTTPTTKWKQPFFFFLFYRFHYSDTSLSRTHVTKTNKTHLRNVHTDIVMERGTRVLISFFLSNQGKCTETEYRICICDVFPRLDTL